MDGYLNYLSLENDSVWDMKPSCVEKGSKRCEDIGPCLRGKRMRRGLKTFFNEKCLLKNKRSAELNVCAWSARRRHKRPEEVFLKKNTTFMFLFWLGILKG
ncbi:hypothetical protein HanPSC8_Chr14g0596771 [Helianthus annuus]|nr:hypothetical protein HanPSC8_Chr14g0596771 [Helianthus annuus]